MSSSRAPSERQKFYFQFITTPTADTPSTAILLHFDSRRYFIGRIAEGTQRACMQRGVGLKKLNTLFLTGPTKWTNMGGLIGMILTIADIQAEIPKTAAERPASEPKPRINIFGGAKIMHAIACARRFVFRTGMPLTVHEATQETSSAEKPVYSDENVDVWTVRLIRSRSGASSPILPDGRSGSPETVGQEQLLRKETVNNMFDSDWKRDRLVESRFDQVKLPATIYTRNPDTKDLDHVRCMTMEDAPHLAPDSIVLVRNPWPASMVGELPAADNLSGSASICYIIRGQPQRGRFLPQKAKELGVRQGPNFARLASGQSVTLENGAIVTSEMVMTPTEPGRAMAVFDVPSVDYLHDLEKKLVELRENKTLTGLEMVTWSLGSGVYYSAEFRAIVASLSDVKHLVSSPDTNSNYLALDSSASSAKRLSLIRPDCFVEPIYSNEIERNDLHKHIPDIPNVTIAERGMIAHLAPNPCINTSEIPEMLDLGTIELEKEVCKLLPTPMAISSPMPYDDIEITTLGTGSALPSKYRNVSATLLRIPGMGSYLFDCGENTLGQLKRSFPAKELDAVLCDLRMIWISHLHADHHLGTLSVIQARKEAVERGVAAHDGSPVYLVSEPTMSDFLMDFSSIQSSPDCVQLSVLNSELRIEGEAVSIESLPLNIKSLKTVRVSHCQGAQAISVVFANDFKFSYSGDCRPSSSFAHIGRNSHVLVHEATFDDDKQGDARAKKHTTTSEALGVATAMKAKSLVLTHFSQRYQKLPVLANIKFADQIQFDEGDDAEADGVQETAENIDTVTQSTGPVAEAVRSKQVASSGALFAEAAASIDLDICVGFDLMRIKYGQIPSMYLYYPAIEHMFEMLQQQSQQAREEAYAQVQEALALKKGLQPPKIVHDTKPDTRSLYDRINRGSSRMRNQSSTADNPSTKATVSALSAGHIGDKNQAVTGQQSGGTETDSSSGLSPTSGRARRKRRREEQERLQQEEEARQKSAKHTN